MTVETLPGAGFQARVLSLPSSRDRRAAVEENFRTFAAPWSFFDALTGDAPCALPESAERQLSRFGRRLGGGEVGAFKSHVRLLEEFEQDPGLQWLLVVEDDVWIDTQFPFSEIIGLLEDRGIHYLRLFARRCKPADVVLNLGPRQLIRFRTDPYGAQAYLIDRTGAERLRQSIRGIDRPIDDHMARCWEHGLDIYSIFPFPAVERGMSLIQKDRAQAQQIQRAKSRFNAAHYVHRARDFTDKRLHNLRVRLNGR
jgi:glycosyl transferase family 25